MITGQPVERTGREWRYCAACQRADGLRIRGKDAKGAVVLECAYCGPKLVKAVPPAPAPAPAAPLEPQGIFA